MKPTTTSLTIWRTLNKYVRHQIFSTGHWMTFCGIGSVKRLNKWLTCHVIHTYAFSVRLYKAGLTEITLSSLNAACSNKHVPSHVTDIICLLFISIFFTAEHMKMTNARLATNCLPSEFSHKYTDKNHTSFHIPQIFTKF